MSDSIYINPAAKKLAIEIGWSLSRCQELVAESLREEQESEDW